MADTKKTKAAAKPRKTSAKKETVTAAPKAAAVPSRDEIQNLAQNYWAQRGFQDGYAEQDWFRAEQELSQSAS